MPWGISDDEMDQALRDIFGEPESDDTQAAPASTTALLTPSQPGITQGILSDVPAHLQVAPTDWSGLDVGLSDTDRTALAGGSPGDYLVGGNSSGSDTSIGFASRNPASQPGAAGALSRLPPQPINLQNAIAVAPSQNDNPAKIAEGIATGLFGGATGAHFSTALALDLSHFGGGDKAVLHSLEGTTSHPIAGPFAAGEAIANSVRDIDDGALPIDAVLGNIVRGGIVYGSAPLIGTIPLPFSGLAGVAASVALNQSLPSGAKIGQGIRESLSSPDYAPILATHPWGGTRPW